MRPEHSETKTDTRVQDYKIDAYESNANLYAFIIDHLKHCRIHLIEEGLTSHQT